MPKISGPSLRALVREIKTKLDDSSKKTQDILLTKAKNCKELAKLNLLQLEQERLISLISTNYTTEDHKVVVQFNEENKEYYLVVKEVTGHMRRSFLIEDQVCLLTELSTTVYTADEIIEKVIEKLQRK